MDIAGTRSPRAAAGGSAGDAGVALRAPPAADRRPGLARATLGRYPAAVGLAAQILSPAERIERLKAAQDEYAPPIADVDGKGTLKGTIRTADGKPPTKPIRFSHQTKTHRGGSMGALNTIQGGEFSVEVLAGTTWLSVDPDDYAPAIVGPFEVRPGQTIDGIKIVLDVDSPRRSP